MIVSLAQEWLELVEPDCLGAAGQRISCRTQISIGRSRLKNFARLDEIANTRRVWVHAEHAERN